MKPSRQRFAEVVRGDHVDLAAACLCIAQEVDPLLEHDTSLELLQKLTVAAYVRLPPSPTPIEVAAALRDALGRSAGYHGRAADFDDLAASLLHEVLGRGHGLPLLLSVIWLEVCERMAQPARAVAIPGRVVVAIGPPDAQVVVDPFAGGVPVEASLLAEPPLELPPVELLLRLLTNIRVLTTRQSPGLRTAATRLWAVELSLLLPRHPAELRRERGQLLVRLGRHLEGAEELETYALVVEDADEPAAGAARRDARSARAQLN